MIKVMIGCPVRNRAWILPRYIESLQNLDYPEELIEYCFIINDSSDNSFNILSDFAGQTKQQVKILTKNFGDKKTLNEKRGIYSFFHLSILRNHLLNAFLKSKCDYLFSVDSDILVPPNSLKLLLMDNCDIISTLVPNGELLNDENLYNILNFTQGRWKHIRIFSRDRIFKVDCTGAAYLIKREVIEKYELRYSSLYGAEDIGFCKDANSKGFDIYCDGRIECKHIMKQINLYT